MVLADNFEQEYETGLVNLANDQMTINSVANKTRGTSLNGSMKPFDYSL